MYYLFCNNIIKGKFNVIFFEVNIIDKKKLFKFYLIYIYEGINSLILIMGKLKFLN